jgi:hypothetical protein
LRETEEYRYPPIVHIWNRLNPDILEEEESTEFDVDGSVKEASILTERK